MGPIKSRRGRALVAGWLISQALVLTACADSDDAQTGADETPDPATMSREERIEFRRQMQAEKVTARADSGEETAVTGEVPQSILDAILVDLENLLTAKRAEFDIVRSEAVRWNDGSLGCPEPGQMYTQSVVDGYRVVIEYQGGSYDYRATADGFFRLCPGYEPPSR